MNIDLREVSSETLQTFQNLLESGPRIFLAATIWTLLIYHEPLGDEVNIDRATFSKSDHVAP